MPGHRIHRFDVTAETFRRAGVQQSPVADLIGGQGGQRPGVQVLMGHRDVTRGRFDRTGVNASTCRFPCRPAAVQNADVRDTCRGQHPPGACGAGPIPVVVDHHGLPRPDSPATCGGLHRRPGRQWVPSAAGDVVVAEVVVQRYVHRAGNMALQVILPPVRLAQGPAHVEHGHRIAGRHAIHQRFSGDQHVSAPSHRVPVRRRSAPMIMPRALAHAGTRWST